MHKMDSMKNWLLSLPLLCHARFCGAGIPLERNEWKRPKRRLYGHRSQQDDHHPLPIRSITPTAVILEEISAPLQNLKKSGPLRGPNGSKQEPPATLPGLFLHLDRDRSAKRANPSSAFSFSRSAWIHLSAERKPVRHSPPPPDETSFPSPTGARSALRPWDGEPDFRKGWNPSLVFEGKKIQNAHFDVYETLWPEDGRLELSR